MSIILQLLSQAFFFVCCQLPFFWLYSAQSQKRFGKLIMRMLKIQIACLQWSMRDGRDSMMPGGVLVWQLKELGCVWPPAVTCFRQKEGTRVGQYQLQKIPSENKLKGQSTGDAEIIFSGPFVFLDLRSCMKFHWGLYAVECWGTSEIERSG